MALPAEAAGLAEASSTGEAASRAATLAGSKSMVGTWTVVFDWDCDGKMKNKNTQASGSIYNAEGNLGCWKARR